MNSVLEIRIIGEDISNLFLAFLLLKKGFKVQVFKKNNIYNKSLKKLFFISHSTKLILAKYNLWNQLKDKAYSIESLSISDISILKKVNISFEDFFFSKSNNNNIGWILCNSDLYDLLFTEISKFEGVFSELNLKVNSAKKDSNKNKRSTLNKNLNSLFMNSFSGKDTKSSIEFTASLRGYIDNRHYSIISENGLIFICPFNKNIFRINWIIKKSFLERIRSIEDSFLLDNLSTILPNGLKIDQIFGTYNITPIITNMFKTESKSENYLIIKKGSTDLLDFRLEGINLSIREVIFIYNQINLFNFNKKSIAFLKLKFLIFKFFKLNISTIFYELFTINNHLLYLFKRIVLYLYKKVKIFKIFVLKITILNF